MIQDFSWYKDIVANGDWYQSTKEWPGKKYFFHSFFYSFRLWIYKSFIHSLLPLDNNFISWYFGTFLILCHGCNLFQSSFAMARDQISFYWIYNTNGNEPWHGTIFDTLVALVTRKNIFPFKLNGKMGKVTFDCPVMFCTIVHFFMFFLGDNGRCHSPTMAEDWIFLCQIFVKSSSIFSIFLK